MDPSPTSIENFLTIDNDEEPLNELNRRGIPDYIKVNYSTLGYQSNLSIWMIFSGKWFIKLFFSLKAHFESALIVKKNLRSFVTSHHIHLHFLADFFASFLFSSCLLHSLWLPKFWFHILKRAFTTAVLPKWVVL